MQLAQILVTLYPQFNRNFNFSALQREEGFLCKCSCSILEWVLSHFMPFGFYAILSTNKADRRH